MKAITFQNKNNFPCLAGFESKLSCFGQWYSYSRRKLSSLKITWG